MRLPLKAESVEDIKKLNRVNTEKFAVTAAKMLKNILNIECTLSEFEYLENGVELHQHFFVTIIFTGTIYGEYIVAMDEKVAIACLKAQSEEMSSEISQNNRQDISDTFSEILNITAGESILTLSENYESLTFSAPRVFFGDTRYPKIKTGKITLLSEMGAIECFVFIDCMKLEIANTYEDALASLRRAHIELQNAHNQLKNQQVMLVQNEKMAALGTLAAGIAHEINTPLTTVVMINDNLKSMMQEAIVDTEAISLDLHKIEKTIVRISKITNSLKTFSSGSQTGTHTNVSVRYIIEDVLFFYGLQLKNKSVQINYNLAPNDLIIKCCLSEISQVILNLLINANDAIENLDDKWISIDVADEGDHIEIKVTDSGPGIPKQIANKIFDPFFTTKQIGKGTGLGLSISKGIIENHGGQLILDQNSKNTCFILKLPKI